MSRFERKRLALGLTQQELADRLGVHQRSVCKWETGDAIPSAPQYPKLAAVFGMTPEEVTHLFDPEPQPEPSAA